MKKISFEFSEDKTSITIIDDDSFMTVVVRENLDLFSEMKKMIISETQKAVGAEKLSNLN